MKKKKVEMFSLKKQKNVFVAVDENIFHINVVDKWKKWSNGKYIRTDSHSQREISEILENMSRQNDADRFCTADINDDDLSIGGHLDLSKWHAISSENAGLVHRRCQNKEDSLFNEYSNAISTPVKR